MAEWARPMMHAKNDLAARRLDAADLAFRLRGLSVDTHRTLKRQDASHDELTELSLRIDELRKKPRLTARSQRRGWKASLRQSAESGCLQLAQRIGSSTAVAAPVVT
jgi:hypothetical protein